MIKNFKMFENNTNIKYVVLISDNFSFDIQNRLYYYNSLVDIYNDILYDLYDRYLEYGKELFDTDEWEGYDFYEFGNNDSFINLNKMTMYFDDFYIKFLELLLKKEPQNINKLKFVIDLPELKEKYPHIFAALDHGLI